MLSKEQSDIIKAIQDLQDKLITDMDGKLPVIFKDLANQVIEISNEFTFDAKDRVKNLQKLRVIKKQIADAIVENSAYQLAVKEVLTGFKENKNLSNKDKRDIELIKRLQDSDPYKKNSSTIKKLENEIELNKIKISHQKRVINICCAFEGK